MGEAMNILKDALKEAQAAEDLRIALADEEHWNKFGNNPNAIAQKTLRDEFAAAALTGLLAHSEDEVGKPVGKREMVWEAAYRIADKMLEQREL